MTLEEFFRSRGLSISGAIITDGEIHRCGTSEKPRSKNGWYCVFDGGAAAIAGNWQEGDGYTYWKDGESEAGSIDWGAVEQQRAEASRKMQEQQAEAAINALEFFDGCARDGYSDYLKNKRIYPHGARFDGNTLIIPLQDADGKTWSYQRINNDGSKYFMSGGRTSGCYYMIAKGNVSKDSLVVVCEGFATGASIHQATDLPVVVAFNSGNLKKVADSLVFRNLLIAADNDKSGVGEKAAKDSGYRYVMPSKEGCDFSDLYLNGDDIAPYFKKDSEPTPDCDLRVHGLVGEIADWITKTAIRPQPILSLAAALSFVGMVKGHRVKGYTDLRTNLLVLAMAPTGGGKEHPQNAIKRLVKQCGLQAHLMGEPVSGAGFLHGLQKADNIGFMVMDEVGRYIGNLSASNAGVHQREIIDYIIKTFSCANSILMGREKSPAAKEPRIDVDQPHFCCYGSTVFEKFRDACGSGEIVDGFLNRWVVLQSKKRSPRQKKVRFSAAPDSIVQKVAKIAERPACDAYGNPQPLEQRFTPEAWEMFESFRDDIELKVESLPYPLNQLYNRTCEHVEKIAHTIAEDEFTGTRDLEAAIRVVEYSNKCVAEFAGLISDNVYEKDFIKIQQIIRDSGEIKRNELTRKTQFITGGAKRRSEIIDALLDSDVIVERKGSNGKLIYKYIERVV